MTTSHDLKNAGLKATLPRLRIINLFEQSKVRHLSAEDVYKQLLADGLDIGLATVYRVLTQFEQAGLLVRHHFESGKAVFELNQGGHHDHLVCLQCGRVEEFFDAEIEKRQMSRSATVCANGRLDSRSIDGSSPSQPRVETAAAARMSPPHRSMSRAPVSRRSAVRADGTTRSPAFRG